MPDRTEANKQHCPYCDQDYFTWTLAEHIYHPDHLLEVIRYKRSAKYRTRQQELPGFDRNPLPHGRR